MNIRPRHLATLAMPLALAACMAGGPGATGVVTPSAQPSAQPSAAEPTATPGGASPAPGGAALPPGVFFREDFNGDKLDGSRWQVFERGGRAIVVDGKLELLVGGLSATFPVVVPLGDNIPDRGPFYVEVGYQLLSNGRISGFNLDYVPPADSDDPGLTEPFMRWGTYANNLNFMFKTETKTYGGLAPAGSLAVKTPRRFRLEYDGKGTYRAIYDTTEITTVESRRHPTKLWFGAYPNKPVGAVSWATWSVDYFESGVLVSPDPATPRPTKAPAATPAPTATSGAEASPAASPSPEA